MIEEITSQGHLFLIYTLCGILIGIFFDIFRILRKTFKTSDFITYIEDIIFGIITGIFLIFMVFVVSSGEIRFYMFFALLLGLTTYMLTISKYFIRLNVTVLKFIKMIIYKILSVILYPIKIVVNLIRKLIAKYILKSFKILTINIKSLTVTKKDKKPSKKKKKNKKVDKKLKLITEK